MAEEGAVGAVVRAEGYEEGKQDGQRGGEDPQGTWADGGGGKPKTSAWRTRPQSYEIVLSIARCQDLAILKLTFKASS